MNYAWVYDTDHIGSDYAEPNNSDKGLMGPRDMKPELRERLDKGEGRKFQIRDDDQELYYTGRIVFEDSSLEQEDELGLPEEAFRPLWDYGTPGAGATEIRYKFNGTWKML